MHLLSDGVNDIRSGMAGPKTLPGRALECNRYAKLSLFEILPSSNHASMMGRVCPLRPKSRRQWALLKPFSNNAECTNFAENPSFSPRQNRLSVSRCELRNQSPRCGQSIRNESPRTLPQRILPFHRLSCGSNEADRSRVTACIPRKRRKTWAPSIMERRSANRVKICLRRSHPDLQRTIATQQICHMLLSPWLAWGLRDSLEITVWECCRTLANCGGLRKSVFPEKKNVFHESPYYIPFHRLRAFGTHLAAWVTSVQDRSVAHQSAEQ